MSTRPAQPEQLIDAVDLLNAELPEPRWAIPGVLPEGLGLLAGAPKAGKSWLAMGLAIAVATGGRALGRVPVEQGDVLYLALEDTQRRLQTRLKILLSDPSRLPWKRLNFATFWPTLDRDGLARLHAWVGDKHDARLVIIDTLAKIRGRRARNGNVYDEDYQLVSELKQLADSAGITVLVIHHRRKMSAEDPVDTVSGSIGLTGGADSLMILQRARAHHDATLTITGRDVEEQELGLQFDPAMGTWSLLGDAATTVDLSNERREILDLLRREPNIGPAAVALRLGKNPSTTKNMLRAMVAADLVESVDGLYHLSS